MYSIFRIRNSTPCRIRCNLGYFIDMLSNFGFTELFGGMILQNADVLITNGVVFSGTTFQR